MAWGRNVGFESFDLEEFLLGRLEGIGTEVSMDWKRNVVVTGGSCIVTFAPMV